MSYSFQRKLYNARSRGYFRTLDLFSGCGGMSLGFHRAGFKSVGCVEINDFARASHERNFAPLSNKDGYSSFSDIRNTEPCDAVSHLSDIGKPEEVIDVVIGGPPCQAFSRLGRAALWRLAGKDHAHAEDERATFFRYFLYYIEKLKPLAFVMENVREIGKFVGRNVAEEIAITADDMGYETRYALLNSVWYGVPQLRERMFIIGIHKEYNIIPEFPLIEHDYDLPVGYSTSRAGTGSHEVLPPYDHYVDHAEINNSLEPAVTAQDAFFDLPPIYEHLDGRIGKGFPRNVKNEVKYLSKDNPYTVLMKKWPSFISKETCTGHVIRYTPRDYETFRRMPHGGMYPEALAVAKEIFNEQLVAEEIRLGRKIPEDSETWVKLYNSIVPPYKEHRYPNKFRKMWPDHPSRTVPAHIGKDSYSHIHFDSNQARCISLREAARLQSFPDSFFLSGSMNVQLVQIGNAVPPLLAFAVAKCLRQQIESVRLIAEQEKLHYTSSN